jgi:methyl-accepting chemotaxis protein
VGTRTDFLVERNKTMFKFSLIVWVATIGFNIIQEEEWMEIFIILGMGVGVFPFVYYATFRLQRFQRMVMYIIMTAAYGIVGTLIYVNPAFETLLFLFLITLMSIVYQQISVALYAGIVTILLLAAVYLYRLEEVYEVMDPLKITFYLMFVLVGMTIFIYYQIYYSNNLLEKNKETLDKTNQQKNDYELVLNETKQSVKAMDEFTDSVQNQMKDITTLIQEMNDKYRVIVNEIATQTENTNDIHEEMGSLIHEVDRVTAESTTLKSISDNMQEMSGNAIFDLKALVSELKSADQSVDSSYKTVINVESKMKEISTFLTFIHDISERTNLLALNASIEASREGSSGKGFKVVAEEVRKLADQSRSSTSTISSIIQELLKEIKRAVQGIKKGEQAMTSCGEQMDRVEKTVVSLSEKTKIVNDQAMKVNDRMLHSKGTIEKMNEKITYVRRGSDKIDQSSREIVQSLDYHHQELNKVMKELILLNEKMKGLKALVRE